MPGAIRTEINVVEDFLHVTGHGQVAAKVAGKIVGP
jgi:hypothetical protein